MASLLSLPAEIVLEIAYDLDFRDLISLSSTCSQLRAVIQFDKFIWLVDNSSPKTTARDEALLNAGSLVLGHLLLYHLKQQATDDDPEDKRILDELVEYGASLSRIPYGDYLRSVFLHDGLTDKVKFMLRHGASFYKVPYGIGQLLREIFEERGPSPELELLFDHGASWHDVEELDILFENTVYEGESPKIDLLRAHGCKLHSVPDEMYQMYNRIECPDCDGPTSDESESELRRAMEILRRLEEDSPTALLEELERVFHNYGLHGPLRCILSEAPEWSLKNVPGGIDSLLANRTQCKDIQTISYLLLHGASLESLPEHQRDIDLLLDWTWRDVGPGEELDHLVNHYGASFNNHSLGLDALLERTYATEGPGTRVDYLVDEWGADLIRVPQGLPKLLEDAAICQGLSSSAVRQLMDNYQISLECVPCGVPQLFVGVIESQPLEDYWSCCKEQIRSPGIDQEGLNLILQAAFRRMGRNVFTEWLLDKGATLCGVPGGVGTLLEHTFRRYGSGGNLDFLIAQTNSSMAEVSCGIDALLEWEILRSDRALIGKMLENAEFLLAQGASLDKVPSGSDKILREVLDRFWHGTRSKWLLEHGAPISILEEWNKMRESKRQARGY